MYGRRTGRSLLGLQIPANSLQGKAGIARAPPPIALSAHQQSAHSLLNNWIVRGDSFQCLKWQGVDLRAVDVVVFPPPAIRIFLGLPMGRASVFYNHTANF